MSSTASEGRHVLSLRGGDHHGRLIRNVRWEHEQSIARPSSRVRPLGFVIRRNLFGAIHRACGHAHGLDQAHQGGAIRGCLEVLNDLGLFPAVADQARTLREVPQAGLW